MLSFEPMIRIFSETITGIDKAGETGFAARSVRTSMGLAGDGTHGVSFDQVIQAVRWTGADMREKYRETSRDRLAISVPEC
jgi:hypothetical protein